MPRLKAAVQARKETALESLRDALRTTGRLIRPRLGCPGYGAVRVALAHWRPDFDDAPEKERLALLRAATQWDVERNSKARPHARMDVERHASLTRELVEWLKAPEAAAKAAASARATSRRHAWGGGAERRAVPVGPRGSSLARLRVRAAHWQYRVALNDRGGRCGRREDGAALFA